MKTISIEQKKQRTETLVKLLIFSVIGFVVAPFVFIAIKGLVGLIVAFVIAFAAIQFAPLVAVKIGNWRIKALKAEAAANPIETLETEWKRRKEELAARETNIRDTYVVLQNVHGQVTTFKEKFPGKPSHFEPKLVKLQQLIDVRSAAYKRAKKELEIFEQTIEEKRQEWEIAKSFAKAQELFDLGQEFQTKIMNDVALLSIQDGMNRAFSELETSLLNAPADEKEEVKISKKESSEDGSLKPLSL